MPIDVQTMKSTEHVDLFERTFQFNVVMLCYSYAIIEGEEISGETEARGRDASKQERGYLC
jgi:hypothetical protein